MNLRLFCYLMILSFLATSVLAKGRTAKKSRYPIVQMIQGKAFQVENVIHIVNREPRHSEKTKPLKKSAVLKDKAVLRTDEKSELRLALSENSVLTLGENSEVQIPAIAWENGAVKEIKLIKGSLRYICQADCERKILTPLTETVSPIGDYVLEYDEKIPQLKFSVHTGEVTFRGMENEASVLLHAGEAATFTGVLDENGEPAFDVLLKGRRVAQGKLSEVEKIPGEKIQKWVQQEAAYHKAVKAPPKPVRKASQICDKPWGELNQCAWVCEKNKKNAQECRTDLGAQCVRMRCNANGEWSDRQEIPASLSSCKAQPIVGSCDY